MSNQNVNTKDVDILLGNPRKSLMIFMVPALLAFIVQNTDAIIDTMWVSGVGPAALAAVGYVTPIFIIIGGIGMGIGTGASVIVSKAIGEGNRDRANLILGQTILLCLIVSAMTIATLFLIGESFINFMSKGNYVEESMAYLIPLIILSPFQIITLALSAIVRSEGGFRKVMLAMILIAVVNGVVDPLLIYGLNMGVAGAAWATGLSKVAATMLLMYYLLSSKTYVDINLNRFRVKLSVMVDIFRVGIPASVGTISIAMISMIINIIITGIEPNHGVAIYGTIMKVFQFIIIPCMALGSALSPICSAAMGQRRVDKVTETYKNAIILGIIMMTIVSIFVFIAADQIMILFTYADGSDILRDDLATAIRIMALAFMVYPMETLTTYLFQSLGRGVSGLISTLIKYVTTIILILIVTASVKTMDAFWISYCLGSVIGQIIVFVWGMKVIRSIAVKNGPTESHSSA